MTTTTTAAEGAWPTTMRAWTYDRAPKGLETALYLNETAPAPPRSALTPDAVLVEVLYMSVNPADYKLAEMGALARPLVSPPAHPGMDFSGRVVQAGARIEGYRPGQLVFGRVEPNRFGTLAQYVVVRNGEGLAPAPEGLGAAELAAVGTCGLTALQTIRPYLPAGGAAAAAPVEVFINGASGGTGSFGVQFAKALGCRVTAACSAANAELCRSLGADEVVDYRAQDVGEVLKARGNVFGLVVDNVGHTPANQQDLYVAANTFLKEDGCFVQVGGGTSRDQIATVAKRALVPGFLGGGKRRFKMAMTAQSHADLVKIGDWVKEGKVKAVIDEEFLFERAPEAYAKLKTGRAKGKIVVKVGGASTG